MKPILIDEATGSHYYMCGKRRCKVWTPREISEMKLWYPTTPNKELAKIFDCTAAVVQRVAIKLGLRKEPKWLLRCKQEYMAYCAYVAKDKIIAYNKSEVKRRQLSKRFGGVKRDKAFGEAISKGLKKWYHNPSNKQYMKEAHRRAMEENPEYYRELYKQSIAKMNQAKEMKRAAGL